MDCLSIDIEYYEIERIAAYLKIASEKNDRTVGKLAAVLKTMREGRFPKCKIVVEYVK